MNFFGLLTIALIVLKLTDAIAWSWWWVLSPLWGLFLVLWVVNAIGAVSKEAEKKARYRAFKKNGY